MKYYITLILGLVFPVSSMARLNIFLYKESGLGRLIVVGFMPSSIYIGQEQARALFGRPKTGLSKRTSPRVLWTPYMYY